MKTPKDMKKLHDQHHKGEKPPMPLQKMMANAQAKKRKSKGK